MEGAWLDWVGNRRTWPNGDSWLMHRGGTWLGEGGAWPGELWLPGGLALSQQEGLP